jgi:hypothetical protein
MHEFLSFTAIALLVGVYSLCLIAGFTIDDEKDDD